MAGLYPQLQAQFAWRCSWHELRKGPLGHPEQHIRAGCLDFCRARPLYAFEIAQRACGMAQHSTSGSLPPRASKIDRQKDRKQTGEPCLHVLELFQRHETGRPRHAAIACSSMEGQWKGSQQGGQQKAGRHACSSRAAAAAGSRSWRAWHTQASKLAGQQGRVAGRAGTACGAPWPSPNGHLEAAMWLLHGSWVAPRACQGTAPYMAEGSQAEWSL